MPFGKSGGSVEKGTDHYYAPLLDGDSNVFSESGPTCNPACLFDLEADLAEATDLASKPEYADILANLTALLDAAGAEGPPPAYIGPDSAKAAMNDLCAGERTSGFLEPLDWP